MTLFTVTNEHFDEIIKCTKATLIYNNSGFVFEGQIGFKHNPSGLAGGLTFPIEGAIFFNEKEIYTGSIVGEIENYFIEYKSFGKIKKKFN